MGCLDCDGELPNGLFSRFQTYFGEESNAAAASIPVWRPSGPGKHVLSYVVKPEDLASKPALVLVNTAKRLFSPTESMILGVFTNDFGIRLIASYPAKQCPFTNGVDRSYPHRALVALFASTSINFSSLGLEEYPLGYLPPYKIVAAAREQLVGLDSEALSKLRSHVYDDPNGNGGITVTPEWNSESGSCRTAQVDLRYLEPDQSGCDFLMREEVRFGKVCTSREPTYKYIYDYLQKAIADPENMLVE